MSKTEIIAELAHLSPEDLADVRAWLDRLTLDKAISPISVPKPSSAGIRTPRLVNRAQSADFIKHVMELPADAAL